MSIESSTKERIEQVVRADRVVLFMKGTRGMPQCGFSAATVGILDSLVADYTTVNVLEDQVIREGIKAFSNWPTIPQLYVNGEFMGGSDIAKQMFNSGELHQVLGLDEPARKTVLLRYFDGLSAPEIAERRGENPVTVRKRLSRALAVLRARLERDMGEGEGGLHCS